MKSEKFFLICLTSVLMFFLFYILTMPDPEPPKRVPIQQQDIPAEVQEGIDILAKALNPMIFKELDKIGDKIDKKNEEIDAIYGLIESGNNTKFTIMDTQFRIYHYIGGHDIRDHFVQGCPECGLIEQLSIRKKEINDEIVQLSEYVANHLDDPHNAEKNQKINELTIESTHVVKYIMGSQDRAKELGKIMYKRIKDANEVQLGTPVPVDTLQPAN